MSTAHKPAYIGGGAYNTAFDKTNKLSQIQSAVSLTLCFICCFAGLRRFIKTVIKQSIKAIKQFNIFKGTPLVYIVSKHCQQLDKFVTHA
jgi:bisphosphoglycerate-dependent phosphoglycerate mutase